MAGILKVTTPSLPGTTAPSLPGTTAPSIPRTPAGSRLPGTAVQSLSGTMPPTILRVPPPSGPNNVKAKEGASYVQCPNPSLGPNDTPTICRYGCCDGQGSGRPWKCCDPPPPQDTSDYVLISKCKLGYIINGLVTGVIVALILVYLLGRRHGKKSAQTPEQQQPSAPQKVTGGQLDVDGTDPEAVPGERISRVLVPEGGLPATTEAPKQPPYYQLTPEQEQFYRDFWTGYFNDKNVWSWPEHGKLSNSHRQSRQPPKYSERQDAGDKPMVPTTVVRWGSGSRETQELDNRAEPEESGTRSVSSYSDTPQEFDDGLESETAMTNRHSDMGSLDQELGEQGGRQTKRSRVLSYMDMQELEDRAKSDSVVVTSEESSPRDEQELEDEVEPKARMNGGQHNPRPSQNRGKNKPDKQHKYTSTIERF